ncbi:MAG: tetratricopeptide repeat protein [Pirellulales bacterium]
MDRPRKPLSLGKKIAFSVITCVVVGLVLEGTLAAIGVRPWYVVQDPYVGFQAGSPLFVAEGTRWRTNPAKLAYFNDQTFPQEKGPRTYRIFCLGGSTTFGHPYDHRAAFGHWLEEQLREAAPDRTWEVINCGGISYASYRDFLVMQELCQYQPDLFIVYVGQNEFLEKRTYGEELRSTGLLPQLKSAVSRTRTATLLASVLHRPTPREVNASETSSANRPALLSAEVDTVLDRSIGPADYERNESWQQDVVRHCNATLARMCGLARAQGTRLIFVSPASNVRDFSPFKSQHGRIGARAEREWAEAVSAGRQARDAGDPQAAVTHFLTAVRVDPQEARGLWEAGRALLAVGRTEEARDLLQRSVDEDVCPLRAPTAIRQGLQEVARQEGVPCIDYPRLLAAAQPPGEAQVALGNESFLDHVHPTPDGHRLLAEALYEQLAAWNIAPARRPDPVREEQIRERVMGNIDSRDQALAVVQVIQVLSWAGKNEEAMSLTDRAEQLHPGLSEVASYRGRLKEKQGQLAAALQDYQEAVRRNPQDALALSRAGWAALRLEQYVDARAYFATAIVHMPVQAPLRIRASTRFGMASSFFQLKQWPEAELELRATLELQPDHAEARELLAQLPTVTPDAHHAEAGGQGR